MDRSTLTWMLGLCMVVGAAAYEFASTTAAVGGVGVVLAVVGALADLRGD